MHNEYCQMFHHPLLRHRHSWRRRFLTKEEKDALTKQYKEKKIQWIEDYKASLEKELKGINERLEELKKETA